MTTEEKMPSFWRTEYTEAPALVDVHGMWLAASEKKEVNLTALATFMGIRTATLWGYSTGKVRWPADVWLAAMGAIGAFHKISALDLKPTKIRKRRGPRKKATPTPVSGSSDHVLRCDDLTTEFITHE